jgi:hypothetical protein
MGGALELRTAPRGLSGPQESVRRWRDLAFGLSLTAGVLAIAFSIWPIAFLRGWSQIAIIWGLVGHIAGAFYLVAGYHARRCHPVASPILSISGLLLIFSGLGSGRLLALADLEFWWLAIAFDLLPITLGVAAAGAVSASVTPAVPFDRTVAGRSATDAAC